MVSPPSRSDGCDGGGSRLYFNKRSPILVITASQPRLPFAVAVVVVVGENFGFPRKRSMSNIL